MITVYRLTTAQYANHLTGEGAKIYGGRWNPVGVAALYTSEFISLAILEILIRAKRAVSPEKYTLLSIQLPPEAITSVSYQSLKTNWEDHIEYTQWIGESYLKENKFLVLKVPSVIVPQEHNFLINPLHPGFKKVKIIGSELLNLDKRLLIQ